MKVKMQIGKVPNELLEKLIFNRLKNKREEVLTRPGIGEDCSILDFGEYICALSCDPITGTSEEIGRLAVHISCNDIASCGIEPLGLMVTILAPPEASEGELGTVMTQIAEHAAAINVDILGGHTEVTESVTRFVVICTAVGRAPKGKALPTGGSKPGDTLIITKYAGMEGTAIIAAKKEAELSEKLGHDIVEEAKGFFNSLSVVREGILSGNFGASSMHDITEGGLLGAVWEMCSASGTGALINRSKIPIALSTRRICEYYDIDPLRLMSSGCMLISCDKGAELAELLNTEGIPAAVIGYVTDDDRCSLFDETGQEDILPPGPDELYKV